MRTQTKVVFGMLTMYIAWGTTYIAIAFAIESMPDSLAMGLRFLAAAALQFALVSATAGVRQFALPRRQLLTALALGALMLAMGIGTVSIAEHAVPVAIVALIVATMPLWTTVLRLLSRDTPRPAALVGVVIGFAGIAVIMQPGATAPRAGGAAGAVTALMLLVLLGNLMWSFGSFLTPRLDLPRNALVLTTYEMLSAGAVLCTVGLVRGQSVSDVADATARSWLGWTYLVIVGSVVGYTTYNWLLAHASITLVSTYSYVNPVVATVMSVAIFHEPVTRTIAVGGGLVVVSVALVVLAERARPVAVSDPVA